MLDHLRNHMHGLFEIQVYVDNDLIPDHDNGIYTIEEAKDQPALAVRGVVVTQDEYEALRKACDDRRQ
jgi:hypothetical protein